MKLSDWIIAFVVIVAANVVGNLLVAKIVSDQASASLNANPLLRLFSSTQ